MSIEAGEDPARRPDLSHRLYHAPGQIRADGAVSALCYPRPRKIPRPAMWTTDPAAVNCPRCRKIQEADG